MILLVTMDSVCLHTINVMQIMTAVTTVMNRDAHLVTYTIDLVFYSYYNIVLQIIAVLMSSGVMVDTMMENVYLTTTNVMDMMTAVITVMKKTATLKV